MENPMTKDDFDTGEKTIQWLLDSKKVYIVAADTAGASQYWVGFKDRKLQNHPKRAKGQGIHAVIKEPVRIKQLENRQDKFEAQLLEVQQAQTEAKQELATVSTTVTSWHADSDKKQDEMLSMLRKGAGRAGKGSQSSGHGSWQQNSYGGDSRQATMYGKGGGSYEKGKYDQDWNYNQSKGKGGQGNQRQPWMQRSSRPVPAHILVYKCQV
jgi:hypothetical protein